jgi:hypothetical protein
MSDGRQRQKQKRQEVLQERARKEKLEDERHKYVPFFILFKLDENYSVAYLCEQEMIFSLVKLENLNEKANHWSCLRFLSSLTRERKVSALMFRTRLVYKARL